MLNIVSQSGSFDPWVKYNSKAGRWYIKGENGEQEVQNPTFVADFENIKTGWLWFAAGAAPSKVWDANLTTPAVKPDENHKRGFSLRLFSQAAFGGVVELSSSSMHICNSINELYTQYEAEKGSNKGQLPVVQYTGATPMKDKHGTNYKPEFKIIKWVARPAELSGDVPAQPAPAREVPKAVASEF